MTDDTKKERAAMHPALAALDAQRRATAKVLRAIAELSNDEARALLGSVLTHIPKDR